jgi:small subunit ribosomal protein S12e
MSAEGDVVVEATVAAGSISVEEALKNVLRASLHVDGLVRGLRESIKVMEAGAAKLCVLAESCDEQNYVQLVEALCNEHAISLIKMPDGKQLGEWCGLCKYDKNGDAQKVVSTSCAVIRDYGAETEYQRVLMDYFKSR